LKRALQSLLNLRKFRITSNLKPAIFQVEVVIIEFSLDIADPEEDSE
jgi:hypothetical protein